MPGTLATCPAGRRGRACPTPSPRLPKSVPGRTLTPYPPGIPVLIPGERVTLEIVEYLEDLTERAVRVSGQEAEALRTVLVVATH